MTKNCLFIIDSLGAGGAERVVLTLARTLSELGHSVSIISIDKLIEYEIDFPVTLHTLNFEKSKWQATYRTYAAALQKLVKQIENDTGKFDLVTAHLQKAHRLTLRAGIANAYYCIHSTISQASLGKRTGLRLYLKRRKLKRLLDDRNIITVSQGIASDLINTVKVSPRSIHTIYNPLDFKLINTLARQQNPFASENYLIHVGRLTESKRHDVLLTAFQQATLNHQINLKLLLLGTGPLLDDLKELSNRLSISERVIFAGFHENPYPILKDAKLCILSSDYEGLPTVLIEALILGVPVISTDCPSGPREIMTGNLARYLTPVGDPDALATMIKTATQDIAHQRYTIDKKKLQKFDAEYAAEQYLALAR